MELLKNHRNIAKIYGYTEDPYSIVMKFYSSGSLDKWIHQTTQRLSKQLIFSFLHDICTGLEFVHSKGLVHADLKPQNVLIDVDEMTGQEFCVLTDFGITQIVTGQALLVHAFQPVNIRPE